MIFRPRSWPATVDRLISAEALRLDSIFPENPREEGGNIVPAL
jgi:hypothetical protein